MRPMGRSLCAMHNAKYIMSTCSAFQSPKSWVAQWTTLCGWLGDLYNLGWSIYAVARNDDKTFMSLMCCLFSTITRAYILGSQVLKAQDFYFKFSNHFEIGWLGTSVACQLLKRLVQFSELHTFVKCRKICWRFIGHKTDYSRCKCGLPVPFMGHIWWQGIRLWTALHMGSNPIAYETKQVVAVGPAQNHVYLAGLNRYQIYR